jgi:hypothetical protein
VAGKYAVSDARGSYTLEFERGSPIDPVRFDHSDWYPGVVEDISGHEDHSIHKTLYRRGRSLTAFQS